MMNMIRHLARDTRGNSVVEMGFVIPIFFTLVAGAVDISRAYSTKLTLEQAAQRSIEWVQVRDFNTSDLTVIKQNAASAAGVSTSAVTVNYWLECNAVKTTWTTACGENQTLARFIEVEVKKDYTPYFGTKLFQSYANGGVVPVKAKAGVRIQ